MAKKSVSGMSSKTAQQEDELEATARAAIENWQSARCGTLKFRADKGRGGLFEIKMAPTFRALGEVCKHLRNNAVPAM